MYIIVRKYIWRKPKKLETRGIGFDINYQNMLRFYRRTHLMNFSPAYDILSRVLKRFFCARTTLSEVTCLNGCES